MNSSTTPKASETLLLKSGHLDYGLKHKFNRNGAIEFLDNYNMRPKNCMTLEMYNSLLLNA